MQITHSLDRWLYRRGRSNPVARFVNRGSAVVRSTGVWASRLAKLEVAGRRTGHIISFPVVIADCEGQRYLVSMLGEEANWVDNVRAAGGPAVLCYGRREPIRLEEVDPAARLPILRSYCACAPEARPDLAVDRNAPDVDFERIAAQVPVFRIMSTHD